MPGHDNAADWVRKARIYVAARRALDTIETAALLEPRAAARRRSRPPRGASRSQDSLPPHNPRAGSAETSESVEKLERAKGFEPRAQPLGAERRKKPRGFDRRASRKWSGRRDSNPRPQPWQGCALPLSYARSASGTGRPGPGKAAAASMGLPARQPPTSLGLADQARLPT